MVFASLQLPSVHRAMKHNTAKKARSEVGAEQIKAPANGFRVIKPWVANNFPHRLWVTTSKRDSLLCLLPPHSINSAVKTPFPGNPHYNVWAAEPGGHGAKAASLRIAEASEEMLSRHSEPCFVHHRQTAPDLESQVNKNINSIGLWERPMLFFSFFSLSSATIIYITNRYKTQSVLSDAGNKFFGV